MSSRGAGYCTNYGCVHYQTGTITLNHAGEFRCRQCKLEGIHELERAIFPPGVTVFARACVEYDFDAGTKEYRRAAIVQDDSLPPDGATYTLRSPLVSTDKRALVLAEALLANLNHYRTSPLDPHVRSAEHVLSLDAPRADFSQRLQDLSRHWPGMPAATGD